MSKKRAEEITRRRNTLIQTASDLDISHLNHLEVVAEDALLTLDDEEVRIDKDTFRYDFIGQNWASAWVSMWA